ncbi:uncharacterized protein K460DRAFT_173668 [Cucurbitaria berberidis CBS 394.84]|uniref:Uncharacterized protein n=1 Tax=Cucurbitaria berberidis CBS 394.84 TaxID=1168544 RepID=A0A9P4G9S9_9PLEO|nr:uncharacterized protein K460DRAFT_173668 [Cucurbitaria berberidis CBS 394.84]KAF1841798.1 hypothetical protein K460DRAFT_173668 [Cucurbitaria berberidis CBS 394.84]
MLTTRRAEMLIRAAWTCIWATRSISMCIRERLHLDPLNSAASPCPRMYSSRDSFLQFRSGRPRGSRRVLGGFVLDDSSPCDEAGRIQ